MLRHYIGLVVDNNVATVGPRLHQYIQTNRVCISSQNGAIDNIHIATIFIFLYIGDVTCVARRRRTARVHTRVYVCAWYVLG